MPGEKKKKEVFRVVATTMTTRRLRTLGATPTPAAHAVEQAAGSCAAPVAPEYRRILAPAFGTVEGTGPSMTGAVSARVNPNRPAALSVTPTSVTPISVTPTIVNPTSKAAVLGGTPGPSTWSPPV